MVRMGWRVLAVALLLGAAGCTARPVAETPAPASVPATPATPASPVSPPAVRTTSPPPTTASSSSPARRPSVSRGPSSTAPLVRPVPHAARAAGLVDVRTVVPDAIADLRYATGDNFVGVPLYPADARCLVHQTMAPGLRVAADRLRRDGYLLVFWDCYRPHPVQVRMFEIVPDPNWVARPGPLARSHEAGRSVDVTLAYAGTDRSCPARQRVQGHCLVDMGTGFDDFTAHAHAFATSGVSTLAQANRGRLRSAMNAGGITVYSGEWWHFDGPGASIGRPHLNAPLS
jgi:D-alanyl-D-alanine dipeptidase